MSQFTVQRRVLTIDKASSMGTGRHLKSITILNDLKSIFE